MSQIQIRRLEKRVSDLEKSTEVIKKDINDKEAALQSQIDDIQNLLLSGSSEALIKEFTCMVGDEEFTGTIDEDTNTINIFVPYGTANITGETNILVSFMLSRGALLFTDVSDEDILLFSGLSEVKFGESLEREFIVLSENGQETETYVVEIELEEVKELTGAAIEDGGADYSVGDMLEVEGGDAIEPAVLEVTGEADGVITSVSIEDAGIYREVPEDPVGVDNGDATFNLTWATIE